MMKTGLFYLFALLIALPLVGGACSGSSVDSMDDNLRIAENFVKNSPTYKFDGIPETFELTDTVSIENAIQYVFEFDCRHPGYGDRTGQQLAQVIEHHVVIITIQNEQIILAIMDARWDMIHQVDLNPRGL